MGNRPVKELLLDAFELPVDYKVNDEDIRNLKEATNRTVPYFIAFTARSGSTFLTHELFSTGKLSEPHEWFNWDYAKTKRQEKNQTFSEYVQSVIEDNRSENGIWGCEINWLQLLALNEIVDPKQFFVNKIRWFFLRRRNVVAQAISNYAADQTHFFHSYQAGSEAEKRVSSLEYDAEAIKSYIRGFLDQEKSFSNWFRNERIVPINVFYEDITSDPAHAVGLFSNVLGVTLPELPAGVNIDNPIKKIGGSKNIEFEARFREEAADFVTEQFKVREPILARASDL